MEITNDTSKGLTPDRPTGEATGHTIVPPLGNGHFQIGTQAITLSYTIGNYNGSLQVTITNDASERPGFQARCQTSRPLQL